MAHDGIMSGHHGVKNRVNRTTEYLFWPGVYSDPKRCLQSCDMYHRAIPKCWVEKVSLGATPNMATPFTRAAIYIVGLAVPVPIRGNRYIVTMVDIATRCPDPVPLRNTDIWTVTEALLKVVSDWGSNFTSDLMKERSRLLSVKHLMTTPNYPLANALAETFNGSMKQRLKIMCQGRPKDCNRYLPALLFAYH